MTLTLPFHGTQEVSGQHFLFLYVGLSVCLFYCAASLVPHTPDAFFNPDKDTTIWAKCGLALLPQLLIFSKRSLTLQEKRGDGVKVDSGDWDVE